MAKAEKGMSIFLDIFRRADKNDDDALSWDEFRGYFADGVMSDGDLDKLFHEIDTHNTNNIDVGEMCAYFTQHLGSFKELFGAVEDMNTHVSKTLTQSAQTYPTASLVEKFVMRFLLKEILNQMAALERPLESASDHLEQHAQRESAVTEKGDKEPVTVKESPPSLPTGGGEVHPGNIIPGRFGRRARRQFSTQTSGSGEPGSGLNQQVERLRTLVDKLENKVNFQGIEEEHVNKEDDNLMVVVQRKLRVLPSEEKAFRASLRVYIEAANTNEDCMHLGVRWYAGAPYFVLYEIWESDEAWKKHLTSAVHKKFQHGNVDYLEVPESVSTLPVPGSWWQRTY